MSNCDSCGQGFPTCISKQGDRIINVIVGGVVYQQPMLITDTYQTKACSDDPEGRSVFEYRVAKVDDGECICDTAEDALEGLLEQQDIFLDAYRRALKELG